ncbi:MAG: hypothetical protein M3N08_09065 [Pseudomonadota bacterium]|nr:hypothetical protein [Pseudomonadota bacterium]
MSEDKSQAKEREIQRLFAKAAWFGSMSVWWFGLGLGLMFMSVQHFHSGGLLQFVFGGVFIFISAWNAGAAVKICGRGWMIMTGITAARSDPRP